MARRIEGIRKKRGKWQAYVDCPDKQHTKTFSLSTPMDVMQQWRADEAKVFGKRIAVADSIAQKVDEYLATKTTMPSLNQRTAHLGLWLHELGRDRAPHSIGSEEIERVLQTWHDAGLARATVRKRRTAIQSFFVWLNGKKGSNPVRGTMNPKPPKAEARAIQYLAIERAIAAMPKYRDTKKGAPQVLSLAPLRAAVIAYVGLPPGVLQAVEPHELSLRDATVYIKGRRKGEGVEPRLLDLSDDGLAAFRAFHAANAYGDFATESLNRSFKRGCQKAGLNPRQVHLYDLRHSFLTEVYRVTHDLATVGRLGLHAEGSVVTERYARGANREVDQAAVQAFSAALAKQRQASLKPAPTTARTRAGSRAGMVPESGVLRHPLAVSGGKA